MNRQQREQLMQAQQQQQSMRTMMGMMNQMVQMSQQAMMGKKCGCPFGRCSQAGMNAANFGGPGMGAPGGVNINLGGGPGMGAPGGVNVNLAGAPGGVNINLGGAPQFGIPQLGGAPAGVNLLAGRPGVPLAGNALGPQALFGGAQAGLSLNFGAGLGLGPVGNPAGALLGGTNLFGSASLNINAAALLV